jgi:heme A synthase
MGYKLLGMAVWRLARFYVRRRYPDLPRKAAIGAAGTVVAAAVAGGVAVAVEKRQRTAGD